MCLRARQDGAGEGRGEGISGSSVEWSISR